MSDAMKDWNDTVKAYNDGDKPVDALIYAGEGLQDRIIELERLIEKVKRILSK